MKLEQCVTIAMPSPVVFAVVCDLRRLPEWAGAIVATTVDSPGPAHVGTTCHVAGVFMDQPFACTFEIIACEADRCLMLKSTRGPLPSVVEWRCASVGRGTLFTQVLAEALGAGAVPPADGLLRAIERQVAEDLARLKARLERTPSLAAQQPVTMDLPLPINSSP